MLKFAFPIKLALAPVGSNKKVWKLPAPVAKVPLLDSKLGDVITLLALDELLELEELLEIELEELLDFDELLELEGLLEFEELLELPEPSSMSMPQPTKLTHNTHANIILIIKSSIIILKSLAKIRPECLARSLLSSKSIIAQHIT